MYFECINYTTIIKNCCNLHLGNNKMRETETEKSKEGRGEKERGGEESSQSPSLLAPVKRASFL